MANQWKIPWEYVGEWKIPWSISERVLGVVYLVFGAKENPT
jgi:hypothetical protein